MTAAELFWSLAIALALAAVHLFGGRLRFLDGVPRSRWLSAAGGVAVAYVFVHVLPDLSARQRHFAETFAGGALGAIETHAYLVALTGLVLFYGVERMVRRPRRGRWPEARHPGRGTFWLHLGSYGIYNFLIGYLLLHREMPGLRALGFYGVAMGLHFLVNDRGLAADQGPAYQHTGRWILAAAAPLGWAVGLATAMPDLAVSALFAFLAGGVILNVLKEELPEERESRFTAFAGGAALYAALLLAT